VTQHSSTQGSSPFDSDVQTGDESKTRGWFSRGYLPHFDKARVPQSITFRLKDAVPRESIEQWRAELLCQDGDGLERPPFAERILRQRIERFADAGRGSCWLARPEIAQIVEDALHYHDGERYRLLAWCVMPNHVHTLIELEPDWPLPKILHTWKSFTAKLVNRVLGREGPVWMREYFDRYVRDEEHMGRVVAYIETNPVTAGLVAAPDEWRWSSARRRGERSRQQIVS